MLAKRLLVRVCSAIVLCMGVAMAATVSATAAVDPPLIEAVKR